MGTAVTIQVLTQHLEDFGWSRYRVTPEPGEEEGLIFTGYVGDDQSPHTVIIDPMVEKGVLRIFAPEVASAPPDTTPADRLHELVYALAALTASSVLASFGYDPSDGDVLVSVAMPIEENDISFEQFKRALGAVLWGISTYGEGLRKIVDGSAKAADILKTRGPVPTEAELGVLRQLLADLEKRVQETQGEGATPEAEPKGG
jgi:hypothetical protein